MQMYNRQELFDSVCFLNGNLGKAVELLKTINGYGFEAYIVGGCVRDMLKHEPINDIDIATNMPIEALKSKFRTADNNGEKHGTILVYQDDVPFEVTQFRTDGKYGDGRHPDSVEYTSSFEEDTARRDFTINALGMDHAGNVIDFHNGMNDMNRYILRTVGNPEERFAEDALRLVRAARFAARYHLDIATDAENAMKQLAPTVGKVAVERINAEFRKAARYGTWKFCEFIRILVDTGLFSEIMPVLPGKVRELFQYISDEKSETTFEFVDFMALIVMVAPEHAESICRNFKCTRQEIQTVLFCRDAMPAYSRMVQISDFDELKLYADKNIGHLQVVYDAWHGFNVNRERELVQSYASRANELGKLATGYMKTIGVQPGEQFGIKYRQIMNAVCKRLKNGEDVSDIELRDLVCKYHRVRYI